MSTDNKESENKNTFEDETVTNIVNALTEAKVFMEICRDNFKEEGLEESVNYTKITIQKIDDVLNELRET